MDNIASVKDKKCEYQLIPCVIPADPRRLQPAGMLKVFTRQFKNKTDLGYWTRQAYRKTLFLICARDLQAKLLLFADNIDFT